MKNLHLMGLPCALALVCGSAAQAIPTIPEGGGWSGHINVGVGIGTSESNMLAGIGPVDLGDDRIPDLSQDPDSKDVALPLVQFEAAYTLADSRTQFYLGNHLVDFLNFDLETTLETHLGIRQEVGPVGRVAISLLATPMATDVWKDPYFTGGKRSNTERTSSGIRFAWDDILSFPFEFQWTAKKINIDDEESGQSLDLDPSERRLLRRQGDVNRVRLDYRWRINDRHQLVPGIGYVDFGLDGDAMAESGPSVHLKYLYDSGGSWRFAGRLYYEDLNSDEVNPIYARKRDVESVGMALTAYYDKPFGWNRWTANAAFSYFSQDNEIDFYDASISMFSVGMQYRID